MKKILAISVMLSLSGLSLADQTDKIIERLEKSGKLDILVDRAIDRSIQKRQLAQKEAQEKELAKVSEKAKDIKGYEKEDHLLGNKDARYTIVLFEDLECPYCKFFNETPKKIVLENPNLNLVSRAFPLQMHLPMAAKEAVAAECIAQQYGNEGYFKFVEYVYKYTKTNGRGIEFSDLGIKDSNYNANLDYMMKLPFVLSHNESHMKVDLEKYKVCYNDLEISKKMQKDIEKVTSIGINGTPTMVLKDNTNNKTKVVTGLVEENELKKIIKEFTK